PELAEKRGRAQEIEAQAAKARADLGTREHDLVGKHATAAQMNNLKELQQKREQLQLKLQGLPGAGDSYIERVRKARGYYVELDKKAQEVEITIISLEAQLVALDKYHADMSAQGARILPATTYNQQARELRGLVADLRKELDAIRNDIVLASDEAGISDALVAEEAEVRGELETAIANEHQAMGPIVSRMSGDDRAQADRLSQLMDQALAIEDQSRKINQRIEGYVDSQLSDAK